MKNILLIILLFISFSSCRSVLDVEPKSFVSEKNAWRTENDVISEIHGAYALLRKACIDGYRFWSYGDFRFGDLNHDQWGRYYSTQDLKNDYFAIEGQTAWTLYYTAIVQCNLVIEKAHEIKDSEYRMYSKEHYLAEARFLRSFLYFYISRIWGDVPLQTKALNTEPLPREKTEKVLEFAAADADYAIAHLPWKYLYNEADIRAVRATRGAAYTLLTHIRMWQHKYKEALVSSKAVMDSLQFSGYTLLPIEKSDEIFKGRSTEGIFEIEFDEKFGESGNKTIGNLTLYKRPWVDADLTSNTATINTDTLAKLYPGTDKRKNLWFQDQSTTKPMVTKFKNAVAARKGFFEDNIVVFRLADLYLLRAEALANEGFEPLAAELLNAVRQRAGADLYDPLVGNLKQWLIDERRRELIGEGHVWFDMIRTKFILTYRGSVFNEANLESGSWTFPVNKYSFITNGQLIQTPYWL